VEGRIFAYSVFYERDFHPYLPDELSLYIKLCNHPLLTTFSQRETMMETIVDIDKLKGLALNTSVSLDQIKSLHRNKGSYPAFRAIVHGIAKWNRNQQLISRVSG
jgi:hypothetical protein